MHEEALHSFGMCVTGVGKYFISSTSHVSSLTYSLVVVCMGHDRDGRVTRIMTLGPELNLLEHGGRQTAGFIADGGNLHYPPKQISLRNDAVEAEGRLFFMSSHNSSTVRQREAAGQRREKMKRSRKL